MVFRILTLDLGEARTLRSFTGSNRVSDIVLERLPNTVLLITSATIITSIIGLYVGVKIATQVGSRLERSVSYFSAISYALPALWLVIIFIILFSFQLRILPSSGMYSVPPPTEPLALFLDKLVHAILPVFTLVIVSVGSWSYAVRTMVLNISQEDFVNVARAKGLPENLVMRRHIIRVAAPPIVTSLILGLTGSLGGAIITEAVFDWPGMGRLYFEAINVMDLPVIIGSTYILTVLFLISIFIADLLYGYFDPRVRTGK